jgi:BirA family transcriptional regulator, biotin operon repressor / biotin---[acetyl-CoA-carboxylase] ligase
MKSDILKSLRESGDYVSGERLSMELGISRVSVWKHVCNLKEDGYVVEASPRGYHLISSPDLLLPCEFPDVERKIHHFREIGSTMAVAKELAKREVEEGTIVIAESQTSGRGRLNREWFSPRGGIYFTIILKPKISLIYAPRINLMASVAVAKAIRKFYGLKAELKWPNDVLIAGRKVCGILAEMEAEVDAINFVNLGVGINVNAAVSRYEKTATSLRDELGREVSRKGFLSTVLKEISEQQAVLTGEELLREWKNLSATLNKSVKIVAPGEEIVGRAIDIDTSGALIVRGEDGSLRSAIAGDCIHLS